MKKGQKYRHFKGKTYEVFGIVSESVEMEKLLTAIEQVMPAIRGLSDMLLEETTITVYDANGEDLIERKVAKMLDAYYFLDEDKTIGAGVLYVREGEPKVFFRTFENFFELLNREEYGGLVQRFSVI